MIRRVGAPPQTGIHYIRRPGVYAILPHASGLLLTLQTRPSVDLQLPGGGVDPGESPIRALHREVFEETGWIITRPRRLGAFRRFAYLPDYDMWAEKMCTVYMAYPTRHIADPTEPHHRAVTTTVQTAISELGNDGDRMFVRRFCL